MTGKSERQKPVTMEDMARLAGVHSRTVADALKGTGRVAPATRERVLRIARELNYLPNAAARALVTGRTGRIAVLSGPLNDYYYANIVHLLEAHLTTGGYEMVLLHTPREARELESATCVSLVDGVIVIGVNWVSEPSLRSLSLVQPCVVINTFQPGFVDHITLSLSPAVKEALQLMFSAGRTRVACVVNDLDATTSEEVRLKTYLDIINKAGRVPEVLDVDTDLSPEKRIESLKRYIAERGCPDAVLCQNDEAAISTFQAITGSGLRVPDDVLLVGCDGLPYMEYFETPLSTIALPMEEICARAFQFLQKRIATPSIPVQVLTLPGRLIVRKSLMPNV